ncbi:O-antigen ligase family protein [Tepidibacter thalassicus]|nr:O-antigen ligase family protein [Tepidibacter thalassicus]
MQIECSEKHNNIDLGILLLGIVLFLNPFFRGLFFEKEMYIAIIVLAVIFVFNLREIDLYSFIHYFALFFGFIYLVNFIFAIDRGKAIYEVIKNSTYILLFMIISNKLKCDNQISFLNLVFVLSGLIVVLIGFSVLFGTFVYKGAIQEGMMSSTFQYHNTFGAYILGVFILALGEISERSSWQNYILNGVAYILFLGFVFSYSRGAWILFPISYLAIVLLLNNEGLMNVIISFFSVILGFAISFLRINKAVSSAKSGWLYIFIGFLAVIIMSFVLDVLFKRKLNINIKRKYVILSLLILGIFAKFLPKSVLQRISSINLKTFTVVERNVFYKDALKIIKDYFVLGTGGGGWQTLYPQYQTYAYTTTQAHNYIIRVFIEVGILGLIFLIGFYLSVLYSSFYVIKHSKDNRIVSVIVAVVVLVLHTFIDFDMALGSYSVLVWTLVAMIAFKYREIRNESLKVKSVSSFAVGVFTVVLFMISLAFGMGILYYEKGVENYRKEKYVDAIKYFEIASKLKFFDADYKVDLAKTQYYYGELKKSRENIEKALKINERNEQAMIEAIRIYLEDREVDKGLNLADKYLKYYPLVDTTYVNYVNIYYTLGVSYIEKDRDKAKKYFEKVVKVAEGVEKINKKLEITKKELLKGVKDVPEYYVKDRFRVNLDKNVLDKINKSKLLVDVL